MVWMFNASVKEAKARGLRIPHDLMWGGTPYSARPDTAFGQGFAAAWAFHSGLNFHWAAHPCR